MRVVIVDDSEVVRGALADVVAAAGHKVVGQAGHGHAGVEKALAVQPDVVVTNWQMPVMDGIEATRHITAAVPQVTVIAVTASDGPDICDDFLAAGAFACVAKNDVAALRNALQAADAASRQPSGSTAHYGS